MSMTMEQQELSTLRAQLAAESDLPMQCEQSTISRQLKFGRITPSLIDVKGLGRPKEFTGREEDFQQWSKKTETFFADDVGVGR